MKGRAVRRKINLQTPFQEGETHALEFTHTAIKANRFQSKQFINLILCSVLNLQKKGPEKCFDPLFPHFFPPRAAIMSCLSCLSDLEQDKESGVKLNNEQISQNN